MQQKQKVTYVVTKVEDKEPTVKYYDKVGRQVTIQNGKKYLPETVRKDFRL